MTYWKWVIHSIAGIQKAFGRIGRRLPRHGSSVAASAASSRTCQRDDQKNGPLQICLNSIQCFSGIHEMEEFNERWLRRILFLIETVSLCDRVNDSSDYVRELKYEVSEKSALSPLFFNGAMKERRNVNRSIYKSCHWLSLIKFSNYWKLREKFTQKTRCIEKVNAEQT